MSDASPLHPSHDFDDKRRFAGIAAAIGAVSAVGTSVSLAMPLLAVVMEKHGVSNFMIGANTAAAGVASLLCTPFVPALARRVGPAWLLLWSVVIGTALFPLFYVFDSLPAWFVLRFIFSMALNATFILSEFWINALAPTARRGFVMGVYGTILSFGFAVGPAILSFAGSDGFLPFAIGTGILALSIIPVVLGLGSAPPMEGGRKGHFLHFLTVVPLATFAAFAMGSVESSVMNFAAIYGLRLGFPEHMATQLVVAVAVGNILSQFPAGYLADKMDKRILLLLIATVGAILAAVTPLFAGSFVWLLIMIGACGGVAACLYTVGLTHLGARLSGADLASANAAFIFMYSIGMLLGPATTGYGMDAIGPHGFLIVCSLFLGAYALLAAWRILTVRRSTAE
ncbi:MFS transporter [Oryzibacter oryziterrae]|uniref:MFS transporter n=1 Tax=Oryzibacter oryziterrae TaxID=2766474 RepID=UPI001F2D15CF|nr:MFS transporter [Oryzibacter oryziterrae]